MLEKLCAVDIEFMKEEWVHLIDILGYEVSSTGKVRNLYSKRERVCPINTHGYRQFAPNGRSKSHRVHRLVAKAFIHNPCPFEYTDVDHIDRNKLNNTVTNLRWCTRKENVRNSKALKLNDNQVQEIRQSSLPQTVLALLYDVSKHHINKIKRGKLR